MSLRKSFSKLYLIPVVWAIVGVFVIASVLKANENILVSGKVWEEGMPFWDTSISVEPGQEFKITLVASNFDQIESVTNVSLIDVLPEHTSYIDDSSFQILTAGGSWDPLVDDNTSPFDGTGVAPHGGIIDPWGFANYKYTVQVDGILPTGTTQLTWEGPILNFTDASGAQTKPQMENTSITVENLPNISGFNILTGNAYKLGDIINISAIGTSGKTAYVEIGSIRIDLTEAGSTYDGSHTVVIGDDFSSVVPRLYFVDTETETKGAYLDFGAQILIDATLPPAPTNLSAVVEEATLQATLTWDLPADESDVLQYNIYYDGASGTVGYEAPITMVMPGINQFTTTPLAVDKAYIFVIRAQDMAGNIEQNIESASVSTDFIPPNPPASLLRPTLTNDIVFQFATSTPILFEWEASDSLDVEYYRVEIDDNSDFSSIILSYDTLGTATSTLITITDATLPDDIYFWRALAIDDAQLVSIAQITPDNSFETDNTNPEIVVTNPQTDGHISGNFTISGTSIDPNTHMGQTTGITSVEVFLTDLTDLVHWDGFNWVDSGTFITATSTDSFLNWEYEFTAPITNSHSYVTGARVTDEAGNYIESALIGLTGNTSQPNISITSPSASSYVGGSIDIQGLSSDPGGTSISDVSVKIQRSSDSKYWDSLLWVDTETWNTATSTDSFVNWIYIFNPDQTSPEGVVFTVTARAIDGVLEHPNQGISSSLVLNKDTTAPIVNTTSPVEASSPYRATTWDADNPIQGTALDSGAGVLFVEVAIQDSSANYWNGADWSSSFVVWLSATSNDNFATWKYLDEATNFIPSKDDIFTIYSRATDNAIGSPNVSEQGSGITIIYDTTNPVVSGAVINNDTLSITTLIKNGDSIHLEAIITDTYQVDMGVANISADLSSITGDATAVQPLSYDIATGLATWPLKTVLGTLDGVLSISITAEDPAGNSSVTLQTDIIIADNTAPTIIIPLMPLSVMAGGAVQNIEWDNTAITDVHLTANPITLEYATSTEWNLISSSETNDGIYEWTLPEIDSQTVLVRITAIDDVELSSSQDSAQFTIDSTVPSVSSTSLTSPNGAEAWKQLTVQQITWDSASITDNFSLATNPITIEYATSTIWNLISSAEINDGTYDWTIPVIDSNTARVRIIAEDEAGNTAFDESDNTFAIGLPPVITEARVMSNNLIEITWNKPLLSVGSFANYSVTGINPTNVSTTTTPTIIELWVQPIGDTAFTASDFAVVLNTVQDTDNFYNEAQESILIIDKQLPQTNIENSYPNSNQLILDTQPMMRISVSEEPSALSIIKVDDIEQTFTYDAQTKTIITTPDIALDYGKHIFSIDLVDIAGNVEINKFWDFYIDNFTMNTIFSAVDFKFAGNLIDSTDITEQQDISISTYGAGFTLYAVLPDSVDDGFGNNITDVDIKEANGVWTNMNGSNLIQVAQVAKLAIPSISPVVNNYVFDLRSTITAIQAAGDYEGELEFVISMQY